MSSFRTTNK